MLQRFSKLNTKLALVIGAILVVFLTVDILHSVKSSRDTAIHEVERWSVLLAETIRVSMNTLMKEEKMGARFVMFESMREEIPGLEKVRMIRGEKVNELFMGVREKKAIPREQKLIADSRKRIEDLGEQLKTTKDVYDRKDIESEIADAQRDIASAEVNLQELQRPLVTVPEEMPNGPQDRQVLDTGKPLFVVEGDRLQVWSPFIARKSCGGAGGCHVGVEEGNVLGAVNMEFSLAGINEEVRRNAAFSIAGKFVLGILIIGSLMFMISRIVTRPLSQAVTVSTAVARGDLTQRIRVASRDEIGQLMQALKDMNESLVGIVGEVRSATDSIATGTKQIAAGNSDLSSRTEQQAASLQETAASMEQMTATVKQNAENARQANLLAENASDVAVRGGQVVNDVVQTMSSISDSSKRIVDIIAVIEGIAFQTNILALNAAVEAARAGEQGRGFAVVAGEVRNLSQRSAAAAKEIKELIGDSVDKVNAGSRLVNQAGETMSEIVTAVKRVTDIMAEISDASNEQSTGIDHVSQAITNMDEVTQQNAALVEEAAAAAESMEEQANSLMHAVSIFRLDSAGGRSQTSVTRPASEHGISTAVKPVREARKLAKVKERNDNSEWKEF